jgi:hypothetical protein
MDTVKPLPVEPFPNPNANGRVTATRKAPLVTPPFRLPEMGEGRPDRLPLGPIHKPRNFWTLT